MAHGILHAFAIKYIIVRNICFIIFLFDWESDFKKASSTNSPSHPQAYAENKKKNRFETRNAKYFFE